MSIRKVTTKAVLSTAPSGTGSGQEGSFTQEATSISTPSTLPTSLAILPATEVSHQQEVASPMLPAVEAFTPKNTALNSAEIPDNMST
jgi:hypothetical protein